MSKHIDVLVTDPHTQHGRGPASGDPLRDPVSPHSTVELHKQGTRGAFLFEGGGAGFMAGHLIAVYHHAGGYPEWTIVREDPREEWAALPREAQEQLLALDLSGGEPDLDVGPDALDAVPAESCFKPSRLSSFEGQRTYEHYLIPEELVGFLWVLQQYERATGEPLKVLNERRDLT